MFGLAASDPLSLPLLGSLRPAHPHQDLLGVVVAYGLNHQAGQGGLARGQFTVLSPIFTL